MNFIYYLAITFFLFACFLLCFVILIQESKSMGLGASLGGGDAGDSLFGTSTADVLKRFTSWLAVIFLGACVILSFWTSAKGPKARRSAPTVIEEEADFSFPQSGM